MSEIIDPQKAAEIYPNGQVIERAPVHAIEFATLALKGALIQAGGKIAITPEQLNKVIDIDFDWTDDGTLIAIAVDRRS